MRVNHLYLILFFVASFAIHGNAQEKLSKNEKEAIQFVFEGNEEITKEKANVIEAEKLYRKAISKDPNNAVAKYNLGVSYHATGNYQEAAQRSAQAAKLAKTQAEKHQAYHNLGNAYMGTSEAGKAIEAYKNALRNNPTDYQTRYNLALAKQLKKEQDKNKSKDGDKNKEKGDNGDNKDEDSKDKNTNKDKEDPNKEDKEEDNKDGEEDENKDDKDENKDEGEEDKKDEDKGDEEKDKRQPNRDGKLSPEQVKSLLQAMENQEKEVQEKVNAEKQKGVRIQSDKDW